MAVEQRQRYRLPDCLANWPWPRRLNRSYPEVKAASSAWVRSFGAFSSKAQDAYDRCDFNLLTSLAYPDHNAADLRTGCDAMNQFFVYDEFSDIARPEEVQVMANIIMDALRDPHKPRPEDEWVGGELTRQFWERAIQTASPGSQKRFLDYSAQYTQAVVQEAEDRQNDYIRTVDEYLVVRRDTSGVKPCFAIIELGLSLPQEVVDHPVIKEMEILGTDMILLFNDIASYNIEQARDDDSHSIATSVMHYHDTDVQGAMDWVENHHRGLEARFLELYYHHVPKYHSCHLDADVARYVDGLGNWIRANEQWSFESERYFGKRGPEIIKNRWMTLMPKERAEYIGPQLVNDVFL
ncbi:terpenoid synthase [Peniophora sp. CONT]|nr:terpenoid synthase [Peniophora sp. CONT]